MQVGRLAGCTHRIDPRYGSQKPDFSQLIGGATGRALGWVGAVRVKPNHTSVDREDQFAQLLPGVHAVEGLLRVGQGPHRIDNGH